MIGPHSGKGRPFWRQMSRIFFVCRRTATSQSAISVWRHQWLIGNQCCSPRLLSSLTFPSVNDGESPENDGHRRNRTVSIGAVDRPVGGGTAKAPHLIPKGHLQRYFPTASTSSQQELLQHLQWIMTKDNLHQDMLLLAPPGSMLSYQLVRLYAELTEREVEVLTVSADTTESDLKQRRELTNGGIKFVDQAPVRAAKHGRLLVMDGIHKAERNVLPTLNNLLENREMNLEDGHYLVSTERYRTLSSGAQEDSLMVPVHEDFRVIALGVPVPPYSGNALDPPLRSRFQNRRVDNLSSVYEDLILQNGVSEGSARVCATMVESLDGAVEGVCFPVTGMASSAKILDRFPAESDASIISRVYPFQKLSAMMASSRPLSDRMQSSAELFGRAVDQVFGEENETADLHQTKYEISNVERIGPSTALVTFRTSDSLKMSNVSVQVPCGRGEVSYDTEDDFVMTPSRSYGLTTMMQEHFAGRHLLLIGPRGEGKTKLLRQFSRLLGYVEGMEVFSLHKDMSSLDLLVRRTGASGSDGGGWTLSPLLRATQNGGLCVLDGVEKLPRGSLSTIQALLCEKEICLPDGRKVSGHSSNDSESIQIHPSFRVIASATTTSNGRNDGMQWLTDEVIAMFSTVGVPSMDTKELDYVMRSRFHECSDAVRKKMLSFHSNLTESAALDSGIPMLSLRHLLRLSKMMDPSTSERPTNEDLYSVLSSLFVTDLLPVSQRETFQALVRKAGIQIPGAPREQSDAILSVNEETVTIGDFQMTRRKTARPGMIPSPHFVDIPDQVATIRELLREWSHSERSFLLLGNQGVGKNKVVDRLCQLAGFEREYIQLHRDSTVGQLTATPYLDQGQLKWKESPLVRAVATGSSIVIDEADKAPLEIVSLLKNLLEDGELLLPDGRTISRHRCDEQGSRIIPVHPDFTAWVLANRPGYPFHGNDLFKEIGDCFATHVIPNSDLSSEIELLSSFAPSVSKKVLRKLANAFSDLRSMADNGDLSYPYSMREAVSIVKHLEKYPGHDLSVVLGNILDIDSYDPTTFDVLLNVFKRNHIHIDNLRKRTSLSDRGQASNLTISFSDDRGQDGQSHTPPALSDPTFGKWDENNEAHVGGNQWAGGTGGSDTAGLGGRGGPFRLDRGHKVHQVSDEAKAEVSAAGKEAARRIAEAALKDRLENINMSEREWEQYESFLAPIKKHINTLKDVLRMAEIKSSERVWLKNQINGELDDAKIIEGAAGERHVFKRRGSNDDSTSNYSKQPRRFRFVLDCSGSMYRFNGFDGRLQRALEVAALIMESFDGHGHKFDYSIVGHSGDSSCIPLVEFGHPAENANMRMQILLKMVAHSQYCSSGDNTLDSLDDAITDILVNRQDQSEEGGVVVLISDANLSRYGIQTRDLTSLLRQGDAQSVKAYCVFIASLGEEAQQIKRSLPPGRGFTCMDASDLPKIVRRILERQLD